MLPYGIPFPDASIIGKQGASGSQMNYSFSKDRLPKGASWPLKRSLLDQALDQANLKDLVYVTYCRNQRRNEVMRADYYGDHVRDFYASGKTSVTVYSVPSEQRAATESALVNEGVKAIVKWLEKAESAGNTWRATNHQFVLEFCFQSLRQTES